MVHTGVAFVSLRASEAAALATIIIVIVDRGRSPLRTRVFPRRAFLLDGTNFMSKAREDRLTLACVKLRPRLGVTPEERQLLQPCQADITLFGDFEAAAATDSLDRAIDYIKVLGKVLEIAHDREYNVMEALAYRLAREILRGFPARRVSVRLRKCPAALSREIDFVEVEVGDS